MSSSSGVKPNDECVQAFNDLKLKKTYKYIIFKLSDDKKEIVVDATSADADYEKFVENLPENDCRYAVYDLEYEIGAGEGKRSKIIFFSWSPDNSPVRSKMVYASSKEAIRRALNGVQSEVQGTDFSEVAYDAILEKVSKAPGSH